MQRVGQAIFAAALLACACSSGGPHVQTAGAATPRAPNSNAGKILEGARKQLEHPAVYTGEYFSMKYPGGDVPAAKGACVDVVIRALRNAGYDLQGLIHEDMKRHFAAYPRRGTRPDTNIDHRRVPNQRAFFARFGRALTTRTGGDFGKQWKPGDIVIWKLPSGQDHIGIVTDRLDAKGLPWVIHNLRVTAEEDVLTEWQIMSHFRYPIR